MTLKSIEVDEMFYLCRLIKSMEPVKITDTAAKEILNIFATKNIPESYKLRLLSEGTGCSGTSYRLGFDKVESDDDEYLINGVPVVLKKKDLIYLIGLEVGFVETKDERGFVFSK